ncbi:MAG: hypothetical protein ABSB70_25015 [Candidatus Velthaea sp.]|jgi:hypothetical protein
MDFPAAVLAHHGVEAIHPDDFFLNVLDPLGVSSDRVRLRRLAIIVVATIIRFDPSRSGSKSDQYVKALVRLAQERSVFHTCAADIKDR